MISFCVLAIRSSDSGSITPNAPFAISAYRWLRSRCSGSVNGMTAGPSLVDCVSPVRVEYCDWVAEYAAETLSLMSGNGALSSVDDLDFAGRPLLGLLARVVGVLRFVVVLSLAPMNLLRRVYVDFLVNIGALCQTPP